MILLKNVYLNGVKTDILIDQNKFEKIAPEIEVLLGNVLDCDGKAILPTFCNMHTHASMMFLRGVGEDLELFDWLQKEIWPREAKLTPEAIYHFSKFAVLEMIKTGTSAFLDMYFYPESTVKAVEETGLRAVLTYCGMDMFDEEKTKTEIKKAGEFLENASGDLVKRALACHALYTCSEKLIKTFKQMANEAGCVFEIHLSETKKEVEDVQKKYGKRPAVLLDEWGILDEKTILAHGVHFDEDEVERIRKSKAVVVHNPVSNLKLNSGQMPLQRYLDKGIRVTLGTDGVSSNNNLSMIDEMKIAALSGKNISNDCRAAKVQDVFDLATVNGFEALGIKAGKIAEGYLADFMLVDLNNFALLPCVNLISNMIYAADSSCIKDVFCNGKQLMKDGRIAGEEEIIENFKRVCKELY